MIFDVIFDIHVIILFKIKRFSYMVDPPILNCINDFDSVVASTRCTKNGASSFVNIVDQFRCQLNDIARVEAFITALQKGRKKNTISRSHNCYIVE
jgi:hypothetical protein